MNSAGPTPPLWRRMACSLYEGVLLFGIVFGTALVYGVLTQQRHGLHGRSGLLVTLFTVTGLYFVWCWTRYGQTLPMQTWHVRLVTADGERVPAWRATLRYLAAWTWFLPGLAGATADRFGSSSVIAAAFLGWWLLYAALSRLMPDRQYPHDLIAGTRLVDFRRQPAPA